MHPVTRHTRDKFRQVRADAPLTGVSVTSSDRGDRVVDLSGQAQSNLSQRRVGGRGAVRKYHGRHRYRGLAKNANRLFVACALANLHAKRHVLMRRSTA